MNVPAFECFSASINILPFSFCISKISFNKSVSYPTFVNYSLHSVRTVSLDFLCYTLACREKMSNQAERTPSISYVPKSAR
ncbi:hypothetical protein FLL97_14830 [Vibrio cholerae]|nr:hypothetical protein FLL97_14830 [Vibrio cholerae]TQP87052.1 hypothetical protein FLL74_13050 [Vibrio cholerae]